jgi:hypothetical protein
MHGFFHDQKAKFVLLTEGLDMDIRLKPMTASCESRDCMEDAPHCAVQYFKCP